MHLRRLQLTNFRNYSSASVDLQPGVTVIIGGNGAGKTSLLEAAQYAFCGRSFRTSRDAEMIMMDGSWFRLEAEVQNGGISIKRMVGYENSKGVRVNPGGGPQWLSPASVLCFSPDDLELVKGPPASRRRFLDEAISRSSPAGQRLILDYGKVLAQRNMFLKRARAGMVPLANITPWDRQLTQLALQIYTKRKEHLIRLSPLFGQAYQEISGNSPGATLAYRSQLEELHSGGDPETAMLGALAESWQGDMERLSTGLGTHRDDVEFILEGKSLRSYGSQGEQRTAVLALLVAIWRMGGEDESSRPILLLDDVMSELDPERRRRLMKTIGISSPRLVCGDAAAFSAAVVDPGNGSLEIGSTDSPGQVIITAADSGLFTGEELAGATVMEVKDGTVMVDVGSGA